MRFTVTLQPANPMNNPHTLMTTIRPNLSRFLTCFDTPKTPAIVAASLLALASLLSAPTAAWAVHPSSWTQTTEADFGDADNDNTVVTNLGDIKLATRTQTLLSLQDHAPIIYDLQALDNGDIYLATGPHTALFRWRNAQIQHILDLPDEQIFSLDQSPDGKLILAISAPTSRIAVLEDDQLNTLVQLPHTRYIWDLLVDNSRLFTATGTDGKLLMIDFDNPQDNDDNPQPTVTELLDADQTNLLCLAQDSHQRIYVGSDTDGLIYRITIDDDDQPHTFVIYDAPEPEIGALLVTDDGTVYAATADAEQARPGRLKDAADANAGRPDTTEQLQQEPADLPQVPPSPDPIQAQQPQQLRNPFMPPATTPDSSEDPVNNPNPQDPTTPNNLRTQSTTPLGSDTDTDLSDFLNTILEKTDPLRQRIEQQTNQALQDGSLNTAKPKTPHLKPSQAHSNSKSNHSSSTNPLGNAIYRITSQGFVSHVFRESVMILGLLNDTSNNNQLLVATGNEGQLFRVDPTAEETTILADLEPLQITAMIHLGDDRLLLATANPASLISMDPGYADTGQYTSEVFDADQTSLWGKLNLIGNIPANTSVQVQTRSGNVQDPDQAAWSIWSVPQTLDHDPNTTALTPRTLPVQSPPARFLQYRLTLTGDTDATPVVDQLKITYVMPNLKPTISSIQANYSNPPNDDSNTDNDAQPSPVLDIQWQAHDPNDDNLRFNLQYRPDASTKWLPLEQDLKKQSFNWHTNRVPDGRYIVRVTASDQLDNTPDMAKSATRRSDPILIDNTPPQFDTLDQRIDQATLWITGQANDELSPIASISYTTDAADDWLPVLPDDLIYDSTRETFTIKIPDLDPGPHVVTVRATDSRGNARYQAVLLQIP